MCSFLIRCLNVSSKTLFCTILSNKNVIQTCTAETDTCRERDREREIDMHMLTHSLGEGGMEFRIIL